MLQTFRKQLAATAAETLRKTWTFNKMAHQCIDLRTLLSGYRNEGSMFKLDWQRVSI